ncbi:MAG: hypothetical protein H8D56_08660 [Planctomycetes bacterium]|nr:hypothetical protein [Planctomycetota bacterium]
MKKCARRAKEQEALIGWALMSRMFESFANVVKGCFITDNPSDTIRIKIDLTFTKS